MRFVMMENNLEREEVLAFLKAVADALGDFVSLMERYLASDSPADRPWAEKPAPQHGRLALEHGIATHRVSLQWARSAMEALARPDPPHLLPLCPERRAAPRVQTPEPFPSVAKWLRYWRTGRDFPVGKGDR